MDADKNMPRLDGAVSDWCGEKYTTIYKESEHNVDGENHWILIGLLV